MLGCHALYNLSHWSGSLAKLRIMLEDASLQSEGLVAEWIRIGRRMMYRLYCTILVL